MAGESGTLRCFVKSGADPRKPYVRVEGDDLFPNSEHYTKENKQIYCPRFLVLAAIHILLISLLLTALFHTMLVSFLVTVAIHILLTTPRNTALRQP